MNLVLTSPTLIEWLMLSTLLFAIGMYGVLTRRNAIGILIALELTLNSAVLNFVAFNSFVTPATVDGSIMAIFIIAASAAEVLAAIAIFVSLFRHRRSMDVTCMNELKEC